MPNDIIHMEILLDLIHKLDGVAKVAADLRVSVEAEMAAARRRENLAASEPELVAVGAASLAS
jgi:hypothetical protein